MKEEVTVDSLGRRLSKVRPVVLDDSAPVPYTNALQVCALAKLSPPTDIAYCFCGLQDTLTGLYALEQELGAALRTAGKLPTVDSCPTHTSRMLSTADSSRAALKAHTSGDPSFVFARLCVSACDACPMV